MIHILIEENYSANSRFLKLLDGISSVARKKHTDVAVYKCASELPSDCRVAILICQSLKWSTDRIQELNDMDIHPLVFGFQYLDTMYKYSSIAPNYTKSAYRLTKYILGADKARVAIVGYNSDSLPDRLKYIGIRYAVGENGGTYEVFKNDGDVISCLDEFEKKCENIDTIVCCNDNVAVTLYNKYPHLLKGRSMCSCSGIKISEFFETPYPVCRIDYYEAGVQLAMLYRFLMKEETIYSTVMTFDMDFSHDEQVPLSFSVGQDIYSHAEVDFYGDKSLFDMENLDRMLDSADDTDLEILAEAAGGATYEAIAENHYLAVNTVKYRFKKMMDTAGVSGRRELLARLDEYGVKFKNFRKTE